MLFEAAPVRFHAYSYLGQYGVQSWLIKPRITQILSFSQWPQRPQSRRHCQCPLSTQSGHKPLLCPCPLVSRIHRLPDGKFSKCTALRTENFPVQCPPPPRCNALDRAAKAPCQNDRVSDSLETLGRRATAAHDCSKRSFAQGQFTHECTQALCIGQVTIPDRLRV